MLSQPSLLEQLGADLDDYYFAKSLFDLKEYERAAFFTRNCSSNLGRFLHLYSRYMAGEKKKNDDLVDILNSTNQVKGRYLKELHAEFTQHYSKTFTVAYTSTDSEPHSLDAWMLWLYGVVLKRLDLTQQAVDILCEAIHGEPMHWGAWLELATYITDREMLNSLKLPDHWMKKLFLAHTYLELHLNDEALEIYSELQETGLQNSTYIKAQIAIAYNNQRVVDQAVAIFKELETIDPYRLDNLDTYSNLLYVKEMRVELSHLAHRVVLIDKYRVETCCIVGNYYSLRLQREKAIQYFQRALRLNPHYLATWTLMGHEYMEMKNTNAAIQCYRQAVEGNKRDYRGWYGLGQTYELLKLPAYSLYYFKQAQKLRPNDSRMLVALGDCFERLDKLEEAKKCFLRAHSIGDIEAIALLKLAKLHGRLGENDRAAVVYDRYLRETEFSDIGDDRGEAYLFLSEYWLQKDKLNLAYDYAQRCALFPETREAGKTKLKEIANRRQHEQNVDDCGSILSARNQRHPPDADGGHSSRLQPLNLNFTP